LHGPTVQPDELLEAIREDDLADALRSVRELEINNPIDQAET